MAVPIEESIIAYLDGRLNDADSAELLHRVSVSPEIRQMFQEHEALRQISYRAARNAVVSPELEESLFARIAASEKSRDIVAPVPFWSLPRISAVAATAAIIALALIAPWRTNDATVNSNRSSVIASVPSGQTGIVPSNSDVTSVTPSQPVTEVIPKSGNLRIAKASPISSENNNVLADASQPVSVPSKTVAETVIQIVPQPSETKNINMPLVGNPPQTLRSLAGMPDLDKAPMFEIGLATDAMPGFNAPADVISQVQPVTSLATEFALRVGLNFDARNQIGLRFTRVAFPDLSVASSTPTGLGYSVANGSFESQVGYAGELFYKHREPIDEGRLYVTGSVGGGVYSLGTLISCELGLEIPVSEKLIGGVSVILSRLHQNGSEQNILSGNEPVIYEGYNIYNTLAGRMEYGLSYRF
jgi:anti-sigma factor RsiW